MSFFTCRKLFDQYIAIIYNRLANLEQGEITGEEERPCNLEPEFI